MIALMNGTITGNELSGAFGTKAEDELGISIELQASHTALMDVTEQCAKWHHLQRHQCAAFLRAFPPYPPRLMADSISGSFS
jgi:hypothetical protein